VTSVIASYTREHDELSWMFLRSEFAGDNYAHWPIERRLEAYLRHHPQLDGVNDGSLLDRVMANIGPANRLGILEPGAQQPDHGPPAHQMITVR
jgi:hypothetical protein